MTTTFRPTSASSDSIGAAKAFGESPACSPTMPSAGARSCRDILKESASAAGASASSADASSATTASLASSPSTRTTELLSTATTSTQRHTQKQEKQGSPTCIRRSSSNSSRVSFGTIEIHVVDPIPVIVPADTTNGEASHQSSTKSTISGETKEEETSSSSMVQQKAPGTFSSLHGHASTKEKASLESSSQHAIPTSSQTCSYQEKEDTSAVTKKATCKDTTTDYEQQPKDLPTPPKEENSTASKQEPIKCGLETYERLRPPRRSRTELFLDAVRERSRRKLSHQPLSEEVTETQKDLADKHHSKAAVAAADVDNNDCTLRRSDAVTSRSSNLSLEATKNRRSKRLDQLQGAAEGEIERSETGGLRSWSSNYGGGARL